MSVRLNVCSVKVLVVRELMRHHGRDIMFQARSFLIVACLVGALSGLGMEEVQAAVSPGPIKASGPVVFYLASNGRRYAFPNEQTFRSWYTDFRGVRTITDVELSRYSYGGNVTYRPGTRLLKRRGDAKIYTVGRGGMLRWLTRESIVKTLYGSNWRRLVDELPDGRVADYVFGDPVRSSSDVSPRAERDATPTIEQNRRSVAAPARPTATAPVSPSATTPSASPSPVPTPRPSASYPVTPLPVPPTPMRPTTATTTRYVPPPVVWPGQITSTRSSPSSGASSAGSSSGSIPVTTSTVDLSPYPGARRAVNVATDSALRTAIQNARPGDVIRVSGSYVFSRQLWIEAKGTEANPIYIVAADGRGSARFTMSGTTDEGINIGNSAKHLVLDGLLFIHAGNNVVHVQGNASYIILRNLTLSDAGTDGDVIKINQADHIIVENSDLARPGRRLDATENEWQEVVDVVDADYVTIRRNWIHDFGNLAGYVKGGAEHAQIVDNFIDGQRVGAGDPAWGIGGWTDTTISHNAVYEALETNFQHNVIAHSLYGALGIYDARNSTVMSNLFLNNDGVILQLRAGNGSDQMSDGVTWRENRVVDTRGSMPNVCEVQSHDLRNISAANNVYWNNGAAISHESDCGFMPGAESGGRTENPGFEDARPTTYEQAMTLVDRVPQ